MRDIVLAGEARQGSRRVPNKMTKPFGDTTLFDIYLKKLEYIQSVKNPFSSIIIGVNKKDTILWEKAQNSSIEVVERNDVSVSDTTNPCDVYNFVGDCKEKYFMHVNGCFALLKPATIMNATKFFLRNKELDSLAPVKERHTWFWDIKTKKPFTIEGHSDGSTELCKPIYESVHCFYIHKISNVIDKNIWWDLKENDPYVYVMEDSEEWLDVDYPFEFEIAEAVWKQKYVKR